MCISGGDNATPARGKLTVVVSPSRFQTEQRLSLFAKPRLRAGVSVSDCLLFLDDAPLLSAPASLGTHRFSATRVSDGAIQIARDATSARLRYAYFPWQSWLKIAT